MKEIDRTTELIVVEAKSRGITVLEFADIDPDVAVLEYQDHHEGIYFSGTDRLGRVTAKYFINKSIATRLLERQGFPVPTEIYSQKISKIENFLVEHKRIVIKPLNGTWGKGVTAGLTKVEKIPAAVSYAQQESRGRKRVICQEHIEGEEYRILVLNNEQVYMAQRVAAHIVGDGVKTVEELVLVRNQESPAGRQVALDEVAAQVVADQDYELSSVPAKGKQVWLTRVANAHAGGTVHEKTDELVDSVRQEALAVANYFKVPLVGIDCITPDISQQMGKIIELNSMPDLTLHQEPTTGEPQNPVGQLAAMLFPETIT